jgi:hypothetical protein
MYGGMEHNVTTRCIVTGNVLWSLDQSVRLGKLIPSQLHAAACRVQVVKRRLRRNLRLLTGLPNWEIGHAPSR